MDINNIDGAAAKVNLKKKEAVVSMAKEIIATIVICLLFRQIGTPFESMVKSSL